MFPINVMPKWVGHVQVSQINSTASASLLFFIKRLALSIRFFGRKWQKSGMVAFAAFATSSQVLPGTY